MNLSCKELSPYSLYLVLEVVAADKVSLYVAG